MSDYSDKTVDELQEELRERDLPVSGNKDELVERLEEADSTSDEGSDDESKAAKVAAAEEGVQEEAQPGDPTDEGSDEQPAAPKDGNSGPDSDQVVKEDGWVVQRGTWRKGPGDDTDSEE